jgi:hypothetical protein
MPNDNLGDPRNITYKTFEETAKAVSQFPEETKRNVLVQFVKSKPELYKDFRTDSCVQQAWTSGCKLKGNTFGRK